MRTRNYDPAQGRFTAKDPLKPGQNTPAESSYVYIGNSPTNRYDPAGTCWWIPGSGDESCWTAELPGTEFIPLEPALDKIGSAFVDTCTSGADYAKANGRWGWTGCVDEFTGVGSARRGVDSFQHGDVADGTVQSANGSAPPTSTWTALSSAPTVWPPPAPTARTCAVSPVQT